MNAHNRDRETPAESPTLSKRQSLLIRQFLLANASTKQITDELERERAEYLEQLKKAGAADLQTEHIPVANKQEGTASRSQFAPVLRLPQNQSSTPVPSAPAPPVSPEIMELIRRRESVASQQTQYLQAFVASTEKQEAKQASQQPASTASPEQKKEKQSLRQIVQGVGKSLRKRRVPVLHQISMVECGAACLAMILSYYGRKTSVSEIREHCGVGRDGLTALNIVKAARKYGMRVKAVSIQENDFRFVSLPAIVHWEFNHFIVLERWTPRYVDIVDPAMGRRRLTAEEFDNSFTGVVIMLEPGVQFSRASTPTQISLRTYIANFIQQAPMSLLQILGASLLLQIFGLVPAILSKVAIDQLIPLKMHDAVTLFGIGMFLVVIAQLVTSLLRASLLLYIQSRVDMQMMFSFFEHMMSLPLRFFLQRSSGDLLARVSSNTVIRDTISNGLLSTILDGSFVITYFFILLSQSVTFTIVVMTVGILQAILLLSTQRQTRELTNRELAAQGKSQGYITEALTGIKTLKAAGAEHRALERWSNLFFDQMNISIRRNYLGVIIDTAMSTLSVSAPLIIIWLGTMQVINGSMQVGTMLALNSLGSSILGPLSSLVMSGRQFQLVRSHLDRISDVVDAEPEQELHEISQPPRLTGHIHLENVSFQYDPNSPPVLQDISVDIIPGQKVAIVGRTGSGKSTLGNILLGLYLPTKGEVYYDGIPLRTLNYQEVRTQFGVVTQEANIFSGSIRENISLNNPSMTMEQVIRAAQAAAIHQDIMRMSMEYETFVSEGGNALSGGQRQRLALARALANSPVVMLLDEATSSLDVVTEQAVEQSMRQLACTQIIIAHRLSTIRNADMILVLHEGKIVERGNHQTLLNKRGYYARLIQSQLASGEISPSQNRSLLNAH